MDRVSVNRVRHFGIVLLTLQVHILRSISVHAVCTLVAVNLIVEMMVHRAGHVRGDHAHNRRATGVLICLESDRFQVVAVMDRLKQQLSFSPCISNVFFARQHLRGQRNSYQSDWQGQ